MECPLTDEQISFFEKNTERPEIVSYWITHDFAEASKDLDIPPPIQSRVYHELSISMNLFSQCVKIADIPFPLPFAQLLDILLLVFIMSGAVYIGFFTRSYYVGPVMAFFVFEGIWGLNELAKTLENPFGRDINHISLVDFHDRFNEACKQVKLAHTFKYKEVIQRPDSENTMKELTEPNKSVSQTACPQKKAAGMNATESKSSSANVSSLATGPEQRDDLGCLGSKLSGAAIPPPKVALDDRGSIYEQLQAASGSQLPRCAGTKVSAPTTAVHAGSIAATSSAGPCQGADLSLDSAGWIQIGQHLAQICQDLHGLLALARSQQSYGGATQPMESFEPRHKFECTDEEALLSRV